MIPLLGNLLVTKGKHGVTWVVYVYFRLPRTPWAQAWVNWCEGDEDIHLHINTDNLVVWIFLLFELAFKSTYFKFELRKGLISRLIYRLYNRPLSCSAGNINFYWVYILWYIYEIHNTFMVNDNYYLHFNFALIGLLAHHHLVGCQVVSVEMFSLTATLCRICHILMWFYIEPLDIMHNFYRHFRLKYVAVDPRTESFYFS